MTSSRAVNREKLGNREKFGSRFALPCMFALSCGVLLAGCAGPTPGPDKQFAGTMSGAVTGAGAGMVTGFQVGAGTGPGAAVGAGLGAVLGGVQGIVQDDIEDEILKSATESEAARARVLAHEALADHYRRRAQVHPGRDIFPADQFFAGDEGKLTVAGGYLVDELAALNRERLPYSRLVIRSYVKSATVEGPADRNEYGESLATRRANAIVNRMALAGVEPRRLVAQGMTLEAPLVLDPVDDPFRYNQAIEIIPLDR
jgi:hypothetical protein